MVEFLSPYKKEGFLDSPDNSGTMASVFSELITISPNTSFLKTVLLQKKLDTKSLMDTANNITPIAHTMNQLDDAYDAAFEGDIQAPLPQLGGTFQGFVLLFFCISYLVLSLVITFMVNTISGGRAAAGAFAAFFVLSILLLAILLRVA